MSRSNDVLLRLFAVLKGLGFTKSGSNLHRRGRDATLLINVQDSKYSNEKYLNVAIEIHKISDVIPPKLSNCHIRLRMEDLIDGSLAGMLKAALSNCVNIDEYSELTNQIGSKISLLACSIDSIEEICSLLAAGRFANALVDRRVRELCATS